MEAYKIRKEDTLWYFYCKRFELGGEEFVKPNNFCTYFRTALLGFAIWHTKVANLFYLWVVYTTVFVASSFVVAIIHVALPDFESLAAMVYISFLFIYLMVLIVTSIIRVIEYTKIRFPRATICACTVMFTYLLVYAYLQDSQHFFWILKWVGIILVGGLLFWIILAVAYLFIKEKHGELIRACATYIKTKKERICPMVELSDDIN